MRRPAAPTAALLVTALAFHVDMLLYYLLVPLLPRYARVRGDNYPCASVTTTPGRLG